MADMYITGEPAGNWETAVGNSALTNYEVDVTGIDDMDKLEQYMQEHAGAIPYEMVNGQKVYIRFAKLPQSNTSVTIQGITSLVQGTAGYLTGYSGEGFWLRVAKGTLLSAIMETMYIAVGANEVAQSVIGDLDSVLDNFCIVGSDDVPVYVDSNGVSYVIEDAIEAVRQKMIELGAYDTGDTEVKSEEITYGADTYEITPHIYVKAMNTGDSISYDFDYPRFSEHPNGVTTIVSAGATVYAYRLEDPGDANIEQYVRYVSTQPFTIKTMKRNKYSDAYTERTQTATAGTGINSFYKTSHTMAKSGTYSAPYGTIECDVQASNYLGQVVPQNGITDKDRIVQIGIIYGTIGGGQGITGMTVADSIPMGFGDATLPLGDVVPGWALRGKDVSMPDEDNIWAKNPVLPLDVPLDDVWTDGYAGDSADTYDGDLADILKDALVDVLPDILDDIIENTDVTDADVYDIPAGDTGNTPPAEPPVLNGSSNGLWTMYNPTKQEVNSFGAWLWSDTLIDQIIRQFNSPIDAVIGFHQIYCTPVTGSPKVIKAGFLDSPVSAAEVTNQYATIDCGQVSVDEYYGNALDYDNTQVSIFLPFVGIVPLNTNVVMGSVLHVIYRIDVFTGTCLAQVKVIKANSNAVMYAFEGNCAVQIPLTGTTYTGMVGALLGGLSASVSFMAGDMYHGTMGALGAITAAGSGLTGVKQSGNMGANAGSLGIRIPYLIITRSASAMPAGFEGLRGIPSTDLVYLGSVSGFTSVRDVHLEGIPATAEEINEIKELLSEGVIL